MKKKSKLGHKGIQGEDSGSASAQDNLKSIRMKVTMSTSCRHTMKPVASVKTTGFPFFGNKNIDRQS